MSNEIKIVIADDHPIVRQGLRMTIEREADLRVVAEAGNGAEALQIITELQPEVVILDVDMPNGNGFDVLRKLRETEKSPAVIMLTVHCEKEFFNSAMKHGAQGYVLKDSTVTDIVQAIRAVFAGQNYLSPAVTSYLFQKNKNLVTNGIEQLTPSEKNILRLISEYKTSNQIAVELFISPHTVKTHRKNICLKLNLEGNHSLMKFALEHKNSL